MAFPQYSLYQTILAVDALANKNTIQIIGLCLFNLMFVREYPMLPMCIT